MCSARLYSGHLSLSRSQLRSRPAEEALAMVEAENAAFQSELEAANKVKTAGTVPNQPHTRASVTLARITC